MHPGGGRRAAVMEIDGGVTAFLEQKRKRDCSPEPEEEMLQPSGTDATAGKEKLPLPEPKPVFNHSIEAIPWGMKVMKVLKIVRYQRICEYDPKQDDFVPIHFCNRNIAFFDFKKESQMGRGPPLHELTRDELKWGEDSVNVISFRILESDVGYPISVYGTVLARDQIDYRCVYLFRRGRDNPQVITSPKDLLTLRGPYRGLGVTDSMFFEIDLKMKDRDTSDRDFSKGVIEHSAILHTKRPMDRQLTSWLSTVELIYTHVPYAVEAALAVNVLSGPSYFNGKVTAWTTEDAENHIILYDNKAAGTETATEGGSVALSRPLVAVPLNAQLMLHICVLDAYQAKFTLGQSDAEHDCQLGPYKLQVKVTWTGGMTRRRRKNMWGRVGDMKFLQ